MHAVGIREPATHEPRSTCIDVCGNERWSVGSYYLC
jgi:hypothetical protein